MAISNLERVGRGLEALKIGLAPCIARQLKAQFKGRWWEEGVERSLRGTVGLEAKRGKKINEEERLTALDVHALLIIMWDNWNEAFSQELGHTGRNYVSELREVRNRWAHQQPFPSEDAHRALDTMTRLLEMIGSREREKTAILARELLRQRFEAEAKKEIKKTLAATESGTAPGLKPWREIATPHPDVASGQYRQAEFAADLFQVLSGRAEPEYQHPKEFFRRTYLTEGLTRLLARAWQRLAAAGGDPVVQLQTNFGGGKTHSMLALYHLFGGDLKKEDVPGLEQVEAEVGEEANVLPFANRAVLSGTSLSVDSSWKKKDGTEIHTLWGEMAWQLGGPDGYALVAEADRHSVSPGSEKIVQLFEKCGPAVVLIDEWVAYARQLIGKKDLPAGTFESAMTFVQALTEAAKAASDALIVAAVPESDIEVGGESGRIALERIQNIFGRLEAVWKPASANESFEIVRRRLFEPIADFSGRDAVRKAFGEMYRSNKAEFPSECREADYEERLASFYPIHPELFDRLYQDWSTLERFQRTRGVLRLMASIIHNLWEREDRSLLIMPSTLPLDSPGVRTEIARYLPEGWSGVIDKDIDGSMSQPLAIDRKNPNLGRYSASRRVARTVFIGSAPSVAAQKVRGIEEVRIKLGCVQPGESPATFGDALRRLSETLTYLYSDGSRYWFDTQPTVARTARDRAAQFKSVQIEDEIIRRLRGIRERGEFAAVHIAPRDSSDVPDMQDCRLVILGPEDPYIKGDTVSLAFKASQEIIEQRGTIPRIYRNMLVFLTPDRERLNDLNQAVRDWMAWTSIKQDEELLNLDAVQRRRAEDGIKKSNDAIEARIGETYIHLLIPTQEGIKPFKLTRIRLQGQDSIVARASRKLIHEEHLILTWSPILLRRELDRWLWKDQNHLNIKQLWQYLCTYIYLPRLRDQSVLVKTIRDGVNSTVWHENYAYASAFDEKSGRYSGLTTAKIPSVTIDNASVIVKPDVAEAQFIKDAQAAGEKYPELKRPADKSAKEGAVKEVEKKPKLRRFHGSVTLDPTRVGRDAGKIAEEVISHLAGLVGSKVDVTMEIQAELPEGVSEEVVRIVQENCNTLKFNSHEFEEE
jgi:predicted AAA+ superfamily ATPase